MAILTTDIVFQLSVVTGSAGNSTASTPAASLGKYMATTALSTGVNALFDDISGAENAGSVVDYRGLLVFNNHATLTYKAPVLYLSAEVAGGAVIAIAIDNIAASAKGSAGAQLAQIANELTLPTGIGAFSAPTTAGAGLALGDIPAGFCKGFWVRRSAANTAALAGDGVTLAVQGDTDA